MDMQRKILSSEHSGLHLICIIVTAISTLSEDSPSTIVFGSSANHTAP